MAHASMSVFFKSSSDSEIRVKNVKMQSLLARGPHFRKIIILRAKIWTFSKDLIDFAPE
jgi:hypothetical protein